MGYGMEQEVLRIIQRSGNWTPAYQNKRPVNSYPQATGNIFG